MIGRLDPFCAEVCPMYRFRKAGDQTACRRCMAMALFEWARKDEESLTRIFGNEIEKGPVKTRP